MPRRSPNNVQPLSQRLDAMCMPVTESGCWWWLGRLDRAGYGSIRVGGKYGKMELAHRASWTVHRGAIPSGLKVLHQCDVPCCVNPDHLFLGTQADNIQDMMEKGRNNPSRGERNGRSKLTAEQVAEIRNAPGSYHALARQYGVGKSMIGYIKTGANWR